MSGILHGAKSVAFLVLSCGPLYEARRKYKTKKDSKKARAVKEQLVTEQPGLYHHPSPMQTNPYWAEEIAAGPNFVKGKKPGSKQVSDRNLASAGTKPEDSTAPSTPAAAGDAASIIEPANDATWNHKLYQREDEDLWGINVKAGDTIKAGQRFVREAFNTAGTTVGNTIRSMEGLIPKFGEDKPEVRHPYFVGRNPPVNDLHPPIVSTTPYDTGSMKWMLQPPPPASVMAGKEKVSCEKNRSRTTSRASTLPPGTPVQGLGSRQSTFKTFEEKSKSRELIKRSKTVGFDGADSETCSETTAAIEEPPKQTEFVEEQIKAKEKAKASQTVMPIEGLTCALLGGFVVEEPLSDREAMEQLCKVYEGDGCDNANLAMPPFEEVKLVDSPAKAPKSALVAAPMTAPTAAPTFAPMDAPKSHAKEKVTPIDGVTYKVVFGSDYDSEEYVEVIQPPKQSSAGCGIANLGLTSIASQPIPTQKPKKEAKKENVMPGAGLTYGLAAGTGYDSPAYLEDMQKPKKSYEGVGYGNLRLPSFATQPQPEVKKVESPVQKQASIWNLYGWYPQAASSGPSTPTTSTPTTSTPSTPILETLNHIAGVRKSEDSAYGSILVPQENKLASLWADDPARVQGRSAAQRLKDEYHRKDAERHRREEEARVAKAEADFMAYVMRPRTPKPALQRPKSDSTFEVKKQRNIHKYEFEKTSSVYSRQCSGGSTLDVEVLEVQKHRNTNRSDFAKSSSVYSRPSDGGSIYSNGPQPSGAKKENKIGYSNIDWSLDL